MTAVTKLGRATWPALVLWFCSVASAFAHALPGSVLIFSTEDERLALSITLPVEDLLIAAPELAPLQDAPSDRVLAPDDVTALAVYFADHLAVQRSTADLDLSLRQASLERAYNDHVGEYALLTLHFDVEGPDSGPLLPMTLIYDAVMHEVRNHRAEVYWDDGDTPIVGLAEFGFRPVDGAQSPVLLEHP